MDFEHWRADGLSCKPLHALFKATKLIQMRYGSIRPLLAGGAALMLPEKPKHQSGKSASLQTKWLCFLQLQVHTTRGTHVGHEVGEASGWLVSEISIKVVSGKSQTCGRG
jgi:hypothetical protein